MDCTAFYYLISRNFICPFTKCNTTFRLYSISVSYTHLLPIGPLAFGDSRLQSRIKHVLHYKKPALWVINLALITVLAAGTALATDRGAKMAGGSGRIGLDGQNGQHEQNGHSQSLRPSTPASSNAGGLPSEKGPVSYTHLTTSLYPCLFSSSR